MKVFLTLCLLLSFSIHSFSQTKVKIGSKDETLYPLSVDQKEYLELLPLKSLFDDKEIIGMGEATHGTKEFFDIKAKFFKFLVTNCNYKVIAIEASTGGCSYINDYIQTGRGDIDSVMQRFDFWVWNTEEVKELVLWMKDYNLQNTEEEKICFYGFDMQNTYSPVEYICDFFESHKFPKYKELLVSARPILTKSKIQIEGLVYDRTSKFSDTLSVFSIHLKKWLADNEALIETTYSRKQFEKINLCAESFFQSAAKPNALVSLNALWKYRDSCMGKNIVTIQKMEKAKMFLWAHNDHITNSYPIDKDTNYVGIPMGTIVKRAFGDKYYSIGFVFNEGSFQARRGPKTMLAALASEKVDKGKLYTVEECVVPIYKKNTLTNALSAINTNAFFINLKNSDNRLFSTSQRYYDCGAVFNNYKLSSIHISAKKQFDGLIYVNKTRRAVPVK